RHAQIIPRQSAFCSGAPYPSGVPAQSEPAGRLADSAACRPVLSAAWLEEAEFELSVPLAKDPRFRPLITRNSLTTTPPHFRLGSIAYAPKESREQQRQRLSPQPSPWLRRR